MAIFAVACGSGDSPSTPQGDASLDAAFDSPSLDYDASLAEVTPCHGLECQQVVCEAQHDTRVVGRVVFATPPVYGPVDPLPFANVYVPNGPVVPLPAGAYCGACGPPLAFPLAGAMTDESGRFELRNVPVGSNIPVVVQRGKLRRTFIVPTVPKCTETVLPSDLVMPSSGSEGELPRIAIATSDDDPVECILRKLGIADSEVGASTAPFAHVHLFHGDGAAVPGAHDAAELVGTPAVLSRYDAVVLPSTTVGSVGGKGGPAEHLIDYVSAGGRLYVTGRAYPWLRDNPFLPPIANWAPWTDVGTVSGTVIDVSPSGAGKWLTAIGAADAQATITLQRVGVVATTAVDSSKALVVAAGPSLLAWHVKLPWGVLTPCGSIDYSSFPATPSGGAAGKTFPVECDAKPLSPQEKLFAFRLLDFPCTSYPPPSP